MKKLFSLEAESVKWPSVAKEGVTIKTICRLKLSGLAIPLRRSVKFPPAAERMRHGETLAEPAAEDHRGRNELDGALG